MFLSSCKAAEKSSAAWGCSGGPAGRCLGLRGEEAGPSPQAAQWLEALSSPTRPPRVLILPELISLLGLQLVSGRGGGSGEQGPGLRLPLGCGVQAGGLPGIDHVLKTQIQKLNGLAFKVCILNDYYFSEIFLLKEPRW